MSQPQVAVKFASGVNKGKISYTFEGSVYVVIGKTPTGYESLYYNPTPCEVEECGIRVVASLVSVPFIDGIATFKV